MRSVTFSLSPTLDAAEAENALDRLARLDGIASARRLRPGSKSSTVRRMGFAYVDDDADIEKLVKDLLGWPELQGVGIPAERGLARP